MKALSVWQPWAGLMAIAAKRYETRSWATRYRGPILIHASKRWNKELSQHRIRLLDALPPSVLEGHLDWSMLRGEPPPLGCILARAELIDCVPTETLSGKLQHHEIEMGDFGACRFAWVHVNVQPFDQPIPWVGRQGLFEVPDEVVEAAIRRACA